MAASGGKRATTRLYLTLFYRSVYGILYLVLVGLLLVTPYDFIRQTLANQDDNVNATSDRQNYNILYIIVAYALTIGLVSLIYAMRLYVNKTQMAAIPKSWVPIDQKDLPSAVHKMIVAGLKRSATVRYSARPRVNDETAPPPQEKTEEEPSKWGKLGLGKAKTAGSEERDALQLPRSHAVWGHIEHPGWASPYSKDLPGVQYETVISELVNLIEAKALTLAPTDPVSQTQPPMPDPDAVALLQRSPSAYLRKYIDQLADLGVLVMTETIQDFVAAYEEARFSDRPVTESQFRNLMHLFAEVLRSMRPLDLAAHGGYEGSMAPTESDIDDDAPRGTNPSTPQGALSVSSRSPSHRQGETALHYRTAPTTPMRRSHWPTDERVSSVESFTQSRWPYSFSEPSNSSVRSGLSDRSGSVIRLAVGYEADGLPYVLSLAETAASR